MIQMQITRVAEKNLALYFPEDQHSALPVWVGFVHSLDKWFSVEKNRKKSAPAVMGFEHWGAMPTPATHSPRVLPQEDSDSLSLTNLTFTKPLKVYFSKSYWKVI